MAATEETMTEREITSEVVARMAAKVGTVYGAICLVKLNINTAVCKRLPQMAMRRRTAKYITVAALAT